MICSIIGTDEETMEILAMMDEMYNKHRKPSDKRSQESEKEKKNGKKRH